MAAKPFAPSRIQDKETLMQRILLASLLLATFAAHAAPAPTPAGVVPERQVTDHGSSTVEEYRRNGQVYQIKVNPDGAPSYMLLDEDHGLKQQNTGSTQRPTLTPSWPLLTF